MNSTQKNILAVTICIVGIFVSLGWASSIDSRWLAYSGSWWGDVWYGFAIPMAITGFAIFKLFGDKK